MNLIDYDKEAKMFNGIKTVDSDMEGWVIGINHCLLDIAHSLAILANDPRDQPRLMADSEYRFFLDWLMCSDPWPISDSPLSEAAMKGIANREAKARGYADWITAYHRFEKDSGKE